MYNKVNDPNVLGRKLNMSSEVVDEQAVLDSLQLEIQILQEKMYEAVSRLGSFTHPQVVNISVDIDKRVLSFQRLLAQR